MKAITTPVTLPQGENAQGPWEGAMPGKEGEWVELSDHQSSSVTFPCKLPCCSWTSQPVQQWVWLWLSHLCPWEMCVDVPNSPVWGTSVGYKGQGETRHTDSPPSTVDICSSGFLLPLVIFSPTTLAKSFWRVSLSWLSHWYFFPYFFFSQKKWSNSHNHLLMMMKVAVITVSNWQFGRLRIIIHLNACKLKYVSTFLGHSQVK